MQALLYGHDPLPGIVAVEPAGPGAVTLYRRPIRDGQTGATTSIRTELDAFSPWVLAGAAALPLLSVGVRQVEPLGGSGLDHLVLFTRWADLTKAVAELRARQVDYVSPPSLVSQYLMRRGRTLFGGLAFEDLHRLQLDIETTSLQPEAPEARVLMVALTDNRGIEEVLTDRRNSEAGLLRAVTERIRDLDPDVIEGHNCFDFDLPYLAARAKRQRVPLEWGRDRSAIRVGQRTDRYKVGARLLPTTRVHIHGRHIIDTYQQVQQYDAAGALESYGLKAVVPGLGLERPGRVHVDRANISDLWKRDPEQLRAYSLDDARDVRDLSAVVTPTQFYQTQLVPRSFQDVASGGTGEKINALLIRAYLAAGYGVPPPDQAQPYPGGYTEVRATGVFRPVVKCDVESLYPAIMLHYRIAPRSDHLDVFLPLLEELTRRRLDAKQRMRSASGATRTYWASIQGSFKILINSFFGYLGYGRANLNDYEASRRITTTGQRLIKQVVGWLEERGCQVIEVDTDGVYFVPPREVRDEAAEEALIEAVGSQLPPGIHLAHDGRYLGMLSLKQKTYVLVTYDRTLMTTGSSLRSRRDEPYLRRFAEKATLALIDGSLDDASELYIQTAETIRAGELGAEDFARRESITRRTFENPNLRRLAKAAQGASIGQQITVYQRLDGSLAPTSAYADDEDRDYLLRRLHDMAGRLAVLCPTKAEFDRLFPLLTAAEDPRQRLVQPSLF
ncbi:MAG: DNA polymerase [Dehalococcoidia bacterium]|nr:DNA polymerase [Dehalococcoidia bacterium]